VCGYRFARSIAAEYGGDLDQPVTFVGWSLGASAALAIGLTEEIDPRGRFVSCYGQVPRPDIIVAISGCHYEGGQLDLVDTEAWGNNEAHVVLLAGEKDTNCPPRETEDAAAEMRSAGYDVDLVMLDGADHFRPGFPRSSGRAIRCGRERSRGGSDRRGDPGCHRRQAAPNLIGHFAPEASPHNEPTV
jgi:dienelactone hydrolase